jgi:transcription initiation factor TFIIH subunit 2
VLDLSFAMVEKDLWPTRHRVTIKYACEFVTEFFEQNPISQLGILGMRDGIATRISNMSGNPSDHIERLRGILEQEPQGNPSLQNALEMCRALLYNTPSHGTREVLIIYGALLTSDPGDIHKTLNNLIKEHIRVSIIGLAAQVAICAELCKRTNAGDDSNYSVAIDEKHFRQLFMTLTTPPVTRTKEQTEASLLKMGFPSRISGGVETMTFCACHHKLTAGGYLCTRCDTKVCSLPAVCPVCELTLLLSTHLARSYHHLFPLKNYVEVPWSAASSTACFACISPFPVEPKSKAKEKEKEKEVERKEEKGVSESGRYACTVCENHFCVDCDVFAHEAVHNCAGCMSDSRGQIDMNGNENGDPMEE